ncbi:hypothetical protein [Carboxydothermus ferrireducens]|nr:hypothetical protein [Carboxydothermus ferrireducens]
MKRNEVTSSVFGNIKMHKTAKKNAEKILAIASVKRYIRVKI